MGDSTAQQQYSHYRLFFFPFFPRRYSNYEEQADPSGAQMDTIPRRLRPSLYYTEERCCTDAGVHECPESHSDLRHVIM